MITNLDFMDPQREEIMKERTGNGRTMICQYCPRELMGRQKTNCSGCRKAHADEARKKRKMSVPRASPRVSRAEMVDIFKQNGLWDK